jgi:OOP family OmpA-OmpF porin
MQSSKSCWSPVTDRLGSDAYNQKLSVARADAVQDYLVFKGIPKDKIETIGWARSSPSCNAIRRIARELIACLAPNRRVEVQAKGESAM